MKDAFEGAGNKVLILSLTGHKLRFLSFVTSGVKFSKILVVT